MAKCYSSTALNRDCSGEKVVNVDNKASSDDEPIKCHDCHPFSYGREGGTKSNPEQVIFHVVRALCDGQYQRPAWHLNLRGEKQKGNSSHEKQLGTQTRHHPIQIIRAGHLAEPVLRRAAWERKPVYHQFETEW